MKIRFEARVHSRRESLGLNCLRPLCLQFMSDYVGGDPQRMVILDTVSAVSLNDAESMAFMARSGGQRAVAAGGGIPGGFEPVH